MRPWLGSMAAQSSGGAGAPLAALHDAMSAYSQPSDSTYRTEIANAGFRLVAVPTYGAMAEQMGGTNGTPSVGQFDYGAWNSATVYPLAELPNTNLSERPSMFMLGKINNNYMGIALWAYENYSGPTALRSLWYPNTTRDQAWWYVDRGQPASNANYLSGSDNTSTIFSDGHQPNSNGYYQTGRFAADDGSWGFAINTNRLDGNGGPYLDNNSNNAFGCENRNGGDSVSNAYWHQRYSTSNYQFYVCIADQDLY